MNERDEGHVMLFPLAARVDCTGAAATVKTEAERFGWPPGAREELATLVGELCTNVVRGGRGGVCTTTLSTERVHIEVVDRGGTRVRAVRNND